MVEDLLEVLPAMLLVGIAAVALIAAILETPSPRHRARPRAGACLAALASALFAVCGGLVASGRAAQAVLTFAAGVATSALAVWLLRAPASDDNGDDGGSRRPETPPAPGPSSDGLDWEAFERDVAAYADRRTPAS